MPDWGSTGKRLGRYILGPSLGKGGMGEVFQAWDTVLSRKVALKLLSSWSAMAALRFMQEATLQARVDHPNVCMVLDVDSSGDLPFIAMQLIQGPPLKEAALDPRGVAEVMQKVVNAIHAAHRMNLIHRDLKPSNILVERGERGGWIPYVCDFGLAKDLSAEVMTLSHGPLGTPAFMAPEQMHLNGASIGPKADIYGLGATMFDLLTGHPPGIQPLEATPGTGGFSKDPKGLVPTLPKDLAHIVTRCLEWHPEDRYLNAAALAEDLRRFLDGEPLQEIKGGYRKALRRMIVRHPFVAASVAVGFALVLGFGGSVVLSRRAMARQARAAEHFIGAVKDLQYTMRIERMLPAHDLRPAFNRVRGRMNDIRNLMMEDGRSSAGPGHFALGWGHLLLREPQKAIEEFNHAWNRGYQTSDVASAWIHALCDAYVDELPVARQSGDEAMESLSKRYLARAQNLLGKVGQGALEPRELIEAQLEILNRNLDQALKLTRAVGADSPWHSEARLIEASAMYKKGFAFQLKGSYEEADHHYRQADDVLNVAKTLVRSDEMVLKAELNRRLAWIAVKADATGISPKDFDEIEVLADQLLVLNPEWLPAIADKLTVIWRRADYEWEAGKDPEPGLRRGLALLADANRIPGSETRLQRDRVNLCRILAESLAFKGKDPTEIVELGMRGTAEDEHTAELLMIFARWKADRGIDPTLDLDRAIRGVERPSFQNRGEYGLLGRSALLWRAKAYWAFFHQGDPSVGCKRSLEAVKRGLEANPNSSEMLIESALSHDLAFRISARKGHPDQTLIQKALQDANRAMAMRPGFPAALRCLAQIQLRIAESSLSKGSPVGTSFTKASVNLSKAKRYDPSHPNQILLEAFRALIGLRQPVPLGQGNTDYQDQFQERVRCLGRIKAYSDEIEEMVLQVPNPTASSVPSS